MRTLFVCLFVLSALCSRGGVFDGVRSLKVEERVAKVQEIYNKQVRYTDSLTSVRSLHELSDLAERLNDQALQCFSLSLLGDQYARIRGANTLSVQLHRDAIQMSERSGLSLMTGICNYRLGRYYYNFKNYPFAFEYMLRADNIFRENNYQGVPDGDEILFFIGSIYYETGDYDKAEMFLQKVQQLKKISQYVQKQSLNTLALIRRQQGDTANALVYFEKTLHAAITQNDSAWMGICYSNIGTIYFHQGKYDAAYTLLRKAANLSLAHKLLGDAHGDLLYLSRTDLMQGRIKQAQQKIDSAIALGPVAATAMARRHLYEAQVLFYETTGQQSKALEVQRKLLLVKDSLSISKDQQAYQKILLRMETEKHLLDIDKIEADAKSATLQRNTIILILVLLLLVLLLLYNRSRLKAINHAAV